MVPHTLHTLPLSVINARSSLLTLDSGPLDSNQSLWCDNGFVETALQPCLKEHLDKRHTDNCSWKKKGILKQWQRDKCRCVRSCGFGMVTWLTLVFYYHLGKIASLSFCPGAGISVHCLVLAYQSYTSLLLSMWPDHLMRYSKMWLLWISCVFCHACLSQCSAPRNFFWYAFQHIFWRPIWVIFH